MTNDRTVLIVDDEPNAVKVLSAILKGDGYTVLESENVDSAMDYVNREDIDAVITDLRMPDKDGFQLFEYISEHNPQLPVLFLTAYGTVDSAVHAVTSGAFYYFIKPPDYQKLKSVLARAVQHRCLMRDFAGMNNRPATMHDPYRLIGETVSMRRVLKTIEAVKDSESNILIQGETGTGKEIIAGNLHFRSKRSDKPFVAVNCAAIPRELIESELFGYDKGAFTGAIGNRVGKFEEAADGTIFLDEIGELEMSIQAKLLRALQERTIERLGSNRKIRVNFRLVSSTNRDLRREIREGKFRADLFYRINVVQIDVPPLRDRRDDIPRLASEFMNEFCLREQRMLTLSDEVVDLFIRYPWPGNVRQLKNIIERAVVLARGPKILPQELPEELLSDYARNTSVAPVKSLRQLEVQAIHSALRECNGNKSQAARKLGISRKCLYKKIGKP